MLGHLGGFLVRVFHHNDEHTRAGAKSKWRLSLGSAKYVNDG